MPDPQSLHIARARPVLTPAAIADSPLGRYRALVDDWEAFAETLCRPLPTCIWANRLRIDVSALTGLLRAEGLDPQPLPGLADALLLPADFRAGRHWWYGVGLAHSQELVSQLPARLLAPAPGQRVLDLCAAPGGKTAQLALAMGNRGTLVANDVAFQRIKALQGNLERLGIANVTTTCQDATRWPRAGGWFDRILVDAPCSSEGTVRRTPRLLARLERSEHTRLQARQIALLCRAVEHCRPGGRLVYSTCTFAPEENELVVDAVLRRFAGRLRVLPVTLPGLRLGAGLTEWQGQPLVSELAHTVRCWPHHNDSGGFYMALLERLGPKCANEGLMEGMPEAVRRDAPLATGDSECAEWRDTLSQRYGFDAADWAPYRLHRQTRRGLHLVAADHVPPEVPQPESQGLFLLRTSARPPKLTTAGALLLGPAARRGRMVLDAGQRDAYLRRECFVATPAQCAASAPGQVIACHAGQALGVALLHRSGTVASLFPRRWSSALGPPLAGDE